MSIVKLLFDHTVPGLNRAMDLYHRRHEAITSNITNAETPGYRATDMTFASEMKRAFGNNPSKLDRTHPGHMDLKGQSAAHLVPDFTGATKADGNNVDIDIQMGKMMQNSGQYNRAASILRKKLRMARMAIRFAQR